LDQPKITSDELEKFKEIVRKDYEKELLKERAVEQATALLNVFDYFTAKN